MLRRVLVQQGPVVQPKNHFAFEPPGYPCIIETMKVFSVFLPLALLILAGCSTTPRVQTDYADNAMFGLYKTYFLVALPPGTDDPSMGPTYINTVNDQVRLSLSEAGFNPEAEEKADMIVAIHGSAVPNFDTYVNRYPAFRHYYHFTYEPVIREYKDRSLIVDVIDGKTLELVWRGWSTTRDIAYADADPEDARAAIAAILATFPPGRDAEAAQE